MRKTMFSIVSILFALPLLAQPTIDFTAFAGYRWGGTIDGETSNLFGADLSIADSSSYGAILGIGLSPNLQVELSANRQESNLDASFGLFDPETFISGVEVTYYQAGVTWEWGRDVRPFVGGSLGAVVIDLDLPETSRETRVAATFSGGVKLHLSERIGLRLEGKMLMIALEESDDCYSCYDETGRAIMQGEVAAGLIIFF
jgi:hypothetical protein